MAVDVDKRVQTTYTVVDRATGNIMRIAQAQKALGKASANSKRMLQGMGAAQAKATQRIAAGEKATTRATGATRKASRAQRQFRSEINNVRYSFIGMTAAALGFFAAMETRKIIKISDAFEQTRVSVAGTLQALGFSKDFEAAMNISAAAMEKIRIQAALLPGEANEYVEVFQLGLAGMRGALKGSLQDIVNFSGHYTALAKSMNVDAPQAGRDLALMLAPERGRAGAMVKTFRQMLSTMKELPGHANLTAKAFNDMSQQARGDLMLKTLEKRKDQIEAAKQTWDAHAGAMKSNIDLIRRIGGAPLFEGMKKALEAMNNRLIDMNTGELKDTMKVIIGIGEGISRGIVAGMGAAVDMAKKLYEWTNKAITAMKDSPGMKAGSAVGAAAGVGALAMGATGPMGAAIAGIVDFASRTEAVTVVFAELMRMSEMMLTPFTALTNAAVLVSGLIGDVLEGALAGFISMITDTVGPVLGFFAGILNEGAVLFQAIRPALLELWKAVGNLFGAIGKFLNPIIRILGTALLGIFKIVRWMLTPVLDGLVTAVMAIITVLGEFIKAMGRFLGALADDFEDLTGVKTSTGGKTDKDMPGGAPKDWIKEFFMGFKSDTKPGPDLDLSGVPIPQTPGARGGGGRAYQDFRYSRFTIDQKFAEGFDPDRIAVAFANDLGKVGETKLQSGFEPLFGIQ